MTEAGVTTMPRPKNQKPLRSAVRREGGTDTITVVGYLYPMRNPEIEQFTKEVPKSGNPDALLMLLTEGFPLVRKTVDDWINASGGRELHETNQFHRYVPEPIPESGRDTSLKLDYKIYLKRTHPDHLPVLKYLAQLPSGRARQVFIRVALIEAYRDPDIRQKVQPLLNKGKQ